MFTTRKITSYSSIVRQLERKMYEALSKSDYKLADEYQAEAYKVRQLQLTYQKQTK